MGDLMIALILIFFLLIIIYAQNSRIKEIRKVKDKYWHESKSLERQILELRDWIKASK